MMGAGQSKMCCFPPFGSKDEEQRPIVNEEHPNYESANSKAHKVLGIDHPTEDTEDVQSDDIVPETSDNLKESKIPVRLGGKSGKESTESSPPSDAEAKANEYLKKLEDLENRNTSTEDHHQTVDEEKPLGEGIRDTLESEKMKGESFVKKTLNKKGSNDDDNADPEKLHVSEKVKDFFKEIFPKSAGDDEGENEKSGEVLESTEEKGIEDKAEKDISKVKDDNTDAMDGKQADENVGSKVQGFFKGFLSKGNAAKDDKAENEEEKFDTEGDNIKKEVKSESDKSFVPTLFTSRQVKDNKNDEQATNEDYLQREGIEENMDKVENYDKESPQQEERSVDSLGDKVQGFFKGIFPKGSKENANEQKGKDDDEEKATEGEENQGKEKSSRIPILFGQNKDKSTNIEDDKEENASDIGPNETKEKKSMIPKFWAKKSEKSKDEDANKESLGEEDDQNDATKKTNVTEKVKGFFKEVLPKSSEGNEEDIDKSVEDTESKADDELNADQENVEETENKKTDGNLGEKMQNLFKDVVPKGTKESEKEGKEEVMGDDTEKNKKGIFPLFGSKSTKGKSNENGKNDDENEDLAIDGIFSQQKKGNDNNDKEYDDEGLETEIKPEKAKTNLLSGLFKKKTPQDEDNEALSTEDDQSKTKDNVDDNINEKGENIADKMQGFLKGMLPSRSKTKQDNDGGAKDIEDSTQNESELETNIESAGADKVKNENSNTNVSEKVKGFFKEVFPKTAEVNEEEGSGEVSTETAEEIKDGDVPEAQDNQEEKGKSEKKSMFPSLFKIGSKDSEEKEKSNLNEAKESNDINDDTEVDKDGDKIGDKVQDFFKGMLPKGSNNKKDTVSENDENKDDVNGNENKENMEKKSIFPSLFGKLGSKDGDERKKDDEIKEPNEINPTDGDTDTGKDSEKSDSNVAEKVKGFLKEVFPKSAEEEEKEEGSELSTEEIPKETAKSEIKDGEAGVSEKEQGADEIEKTQKDEENSPDKIGDKVQGFFKGMIPKGSLKGKDTENKNTEEENKESVQKDEKEETQNVEKKSIIPSFFSKFSSKDTDEKEKEKSAINDSATKEANEITDTDGTDLNKDTNKPDSHVGEKVKGFFKELLPKSAERNDEDVSEESTEEIPKNEKNEVLENNTSLDDGEKTQNDEKKTQDKIGDKVQSFFTGIIQTGPLKKKDTENEIHDENNDIKEDEDKEKDKVEKKSIFPSLFGKIGSKDVDNNEKSNFDDDKTQTNEIPQEVNKVSENTGVDDDEHVQNQEETNSDKIGNKFQDFFKGIIPKKKIDDAEKNNEDKSADNPEEKIEKESIFPSIFGKKGSKDVDEKEIAEEDNDESESKMDNATDGTGMDQDKAKTDTNVADKVKGFFKEVFPKSAEEEEKEGYELSTEEKPKEMKDTSDVNAENELQDSNVVDVITVTPPPENEDSKKNIGEKFQGFLKGILPKGSKDNEKDTGIEGEPDKNMTVTEEQDKGFQSEKEKKNLLAGLFSKNTDTDNLKEDDTSEKNIKPNGNGEKTTDPENQSVNVSEKFKDFFKEVLPKAGVSEDVKDDEKLKDKDINENVDDVSNTNNVDENQSTVLDGDTHVKEKDVQKDKTKESRIPVLFGKRKKDDKEENTLEEDNSDNRSMEHFKESLKDTANIHQLLADSLANIEHHDENADDESGKDKENYSEEKPSKIPVKDTKDIIESDKPKSPSFAVTVIKGQDEKENEISDSFVKNTKDDISDNEDHAKVLPGGKIITDDLNEDTPRSLKSVPPPSRIPRLSDSKETSTDPESMKEEPSDALTKTTNSPEVMQDGDGVISQTSDDTGIEDDLHSSPSDDTVVEDTSSVLKPEDDTLTNTNGTENSLATVQKRDDECHPSDSKDLHGSLEGEEKITAKTEDVDNGGKDFTGVEDGINNHSGQRPSKGTIDSAMTSEEGIDSGKTILAPKGSNRAVSGTNDDDELKTDRAGDDLYHRNQKLDYVGVDESVNNHEIEGVPGENIDSIQTPGKCFDGGQNMLSPSERDAQETPTDNVKADFNAGVDNSIDYHKHKGVSEENIDSTKQLGRYAGADETMRGTQENNARVYEDNNANEKDHDPSVEDGIDNIKGQEHRRENINPSLSSPERIDVGENIVTPNGKDLQQNNEDEPEEEEEEDDTGIWEDVLNKQLLSTGDVNHAAMINIHDAENVKAANFQPSIRGVKSLIEALDGDTATIDEDGLLLGSTEYPYPFTPKKVVKGELIHAVTPDGRKDCTVYKTKKHIIISTYLNEAHSNAVKRVQEVAKYIQKNLEV